MKIAKWNRKKDARTENGSEMNAKMHDFYTCHHGYNLIKYKYLGKETESLYCILCGQTILWNYVCVTERRKEKKNKWTIHHY